MIKFLSSQCILLTTLCLGGYVAANAQQKVIKEVPARMIQSLEGVDLYHEYCAVCHGVQGKGDGPAADAMKKRPTDLTQMTRKNGGKFPALAVQTSIKGSKGSTEILSHGTHEMPVWGSIFSQSGAQRDLGEMRITALMKYLEGIQAK